MSSKQRILSIDALRGFDMIWILGLEGIFAALFTASNWHGFKLAEQQMQHSTWHGLTSYDLIFPLFIFLSGVTIGITSKALHNYPLEKQHQLKKSAYKRLFLLLFLGIIYNHGWGTGMPLSLDQIRYPSVLGRIGIAWFGATLCVWYLSKNKQYCVAAATLLGYWALLSFVKIGSYGGGDLSSSNALNAWFDLNLLPGIRYQNLAIDPEGILSNIPSILNALAGVFIGRMIKQWQNQPYQLLARIVSVGVACLIIGYGWSVLLPLNKVLWTSSFVIVSSGYCCLILALFYWLIDILKWSIYLKFARFFAVIGINSIIIYLASSLINWQYTNLSLFGGLHSILPAQWQAVASVITLVLFQWLVLFYLYKRNIIIKV